MDNDGWDLLLIFFSTLRKPSVNRTGLQALTLAGTTRDNPALDLQAVPRQPTINDVTSMVKEGGKLYF